MSDKVLLEMNGITKVFPGVKALDNVSFRVQEHHIHALVGENGAGKSTLMNVLSGIHRYGSYEGEIIFDGEKVTDIKTTYGKDNLAGGLTLRRGKKNYKKIILK